MYSKFIQHKLNYQFTCNFIIVHKLYGKYMYNSDNDLSSNYNEKQSYCAVYSEVYSELWFQSRARKTAGTGTSLQGYFSYENNFSFSH